MCKTVIDDPTVIDKTFGKKIDWDWTCRSLESHLIDFSDVYGNYTLKLEHKKDTVILHYGYFYNHPGTIDEEYSRNITIKILEKDSILLDRIYTATNPHFIVSTDHFSVWDWGEFQKNQEITGYLLFTKISRKKYQVYLNLDLMEGAEKRKLVDKFLSFE